MAFLHIAEINIRYETLKESETSHPELKTKSDAIGNEIEDENFNIPRI
jgi:hypothetical protein